MKNRTLLCIVFLSFAPIVLGQSKTTSALGGTVSDPSDSAIPSAKVTITNIESGLKRETASDTHGEYRFVLLPPGTYEIKAEAQGFSPLSRKNIQLTVGGDLELDLKLTLGSATQTIEVESAVPFIETERSQQANTIGQQ